MNSAKQILKQYWNHDSFRSNQENIIQSVLDGKDTLALLPTGGGKSICFQIPALLKEGLCLVISPLIALMKDQVENLLHKNIAAAFINSSMSWYETQSVLENAALGNFKFLYVSPERLQSYAFKEYLHHLDITLIAVDEAHCISQWGYDFRPQYLRIAELRQELKNIPIIALTASATPIVQKDIIQQLQFKEENIFHQSFEKANLSYSVFHVDSKINKVFDILKNVSGSGIIYCSSRKQTKNVADLLCLQNISADYYHAGLTQEQRTYKQNAWINNQTRIMVCTNAFGMGIDKPDVRAVIHFDIPDCIENYYQEAGRAGRDGKKSFAVLLYQTNNEQDLKALPDKRFPSVQEIRNVYQCLADFLQIPVGLGEGNYYDFDLIAFVKNFKLDIHIAINVLKVLEQEGHLTFDENIFLPSQVCFTAEKFVLNEMEFAHPQLDTVMKCLLRTYQGIYDNRVSINEKQIAKLCKLPYEKIYADLKQLHALHIIEYLPQKETPQIHFMMNRAPAQHLHINQDNYFNRKKQYQIRVDTMIDYLHLNTNCRSAFIANYFGDEVIKDCGVCDNCLNKKSTPPNTNDFTSIEQSIYAAIPSAGIDVKELIQLHTHIKKENFWKVFEFLQSEGKIKANKEGKLIKY